MTEIGNAHFSGNFKLGTTKLFPGELKISQRSTNLTIKGNKSFITVELPLSKKIKGNLFDGTKVSLIDCFYTSCYSELVDGNGLSHSADIFPHYVISGEIHLPIKQKSITKIRFTVEDVTSLFHDYNAFGTVKDASVYINDISSSWGELRKPEIGPSPIISYFTGKRNIFKAVTVIGNVSAKHYPSYGLGGPSGVKINNEIIIEIDFTEPIFFEEARERFYTLMHFFELMIGRQQNYSKLILGVVDDDEELKWLKVYDCMFKPPKRSDDDKQPHNSDVLVRAASQPEHFSQVITNWLEKNEAWFDARTRFFDTFLEGASHSIDRLICAANMFDILPNNAVPVKVELNQELFDAKEECRKIMKKLEHSDERASIFGALGRIGTAILKQKLLHRINIIDNKVGAKFLNLDKVASLAVNCRNYFVHGTINNNDPENYYLALPFLTNTLEFIFATSDLIETGWDIDSWVATGTTMSHPFGAYRASYLQNYTRLASLFPKL